MEDKDEFKEESPPPRFERTEEEKHLHARLESFGDIVFGFSIFMLANNVDVPETPQELAKQWRDLAAFAANFGVLSFLWWRFHRLHRDYFVADRINIPLNFALLGAVAMFSYPSQLYIKFANSPLVYRSYSLGLGLIGLLFALLMTRGLQVRWKSLERHEKRVGWEATAKALLAGVLLTFATLLRGQGLLLSFVIGGAILCGSLLVSDVARRRYGSEKPPSLPSEHSPPPS